MRRLIVFVGLPRSGKSTHAKQLSRKIGAPIVNPDSVRLAVHGQRYVQSEEPFVWVVIKTMVVALFEAGHEEVIIDACNNTRKRRDDWRFGDWEVVFEVIDTSVEVCLERAEGDDEIIPVIKRMHQHHGPLEKDEGPYKKVTSSGMYVS